MSERIILSENIDKFLESLNKPQRACNSSSHNKNLTVLKHVKSQPEQHHQIFFQTIKTGSKQQQKISSSPQLIMVRSSQQLQSDFQQSKTIIASLNSQIDDLFRKITQLTDQVASNLKDSQSSKQKMQNKNASISPQKLLIQEQKNICNVSSNFPLMTLQKDQKEKTRQTSKIIEKKSEDLFVSFKISQPQFSVIENGGLKTSDFQFGKVLGYGKFGQAILCKNYKTGMQCVIKKIFKSTIAQYAMEKQLIIQLQALKRLNHSNLVQTYTSFTDQFHIFIVMQYAYGSCLTSMFNSQEKIVSSIIRQVLLAIQHMHQVGVVHRDIKPQNIIINDHGQIKICDLGWASLDGKQLDIFCGTLDYICPEMADNQTYTEKIDLWNVGVLAYQLIFGKPPFKGMNKKQTIQKVKRLQFEYPQDKQISQQCKQFIQGFLKRQRQREDLKWGLQHSFITKYEKPKFALKLELYNDFNILFY